MKLARSDARQTREDSGRGREDRLEITVVEGTTGWRIIL